MLSWREKNGEKLSFRHISDESTSSLIGSVIMKVVKDGYLQSITQRLSD